MKTIKLLMISLAVTAMTFFLGSCSSSDDNDSGGGKTVSSVKITYCYYTTQDILDLCDISIKYLDASGITQSVNMNNETYRDTTISSTQAKIWKKSITVTSSPANLGLQAVVTPKSTADLTSSSKINCVSKVLVKCESDSYSGLSSSSTTNVSIGVSRSKLTSWLSTAKSANISGYKLTFSNDGIVFVQQAPSF